MGLGELLEGCVERKEEAQEEKVEIPLRICWRVVLIETPLAESTSPQNGRDTRKKNTTPPHGETEDASSVLFG